MTGRVPSRASRVIVASLVVLDASLVTLAVAVSSHLGDVDPLSLWHGALTFAVVVATVVVCFALAGLYRAERRTSRGYELQRVGTHLSLALLLSLAVTIVVPGHGPVVSGASLVLAWGLSLGFVAAGRLAHRAVLGLARRHGLATDRLLIVGTGSTAGTIYERIARQPWLGYEVIGFLAHPGEEPNGSPPHGDLPVFGTTERLAEVATRHRVTELMLAIEGATHAELIDLIERVRYLPVNVTVFPDSLRLVAGDEMRVGDLDGFPVVTLSRGEAKRWQRHAKRALDVVVSAVVLTLAAPLLLLLALLIRLDSPGPVFFVQERVGLHGVPFKLLKLRSMGIDAEAETGPVFAAPDDPRCTRVGRIMRRYALDELPQFINVLRGEMSLVGPRPERPHFVKHFSHAIPHYLARHAEKPGITGWSQVNGLRGDTSIAERTRFDLHYVENWTLRFDLVIMLRTLGAVWTQRHGPDPETRFPSDMAVLTAARSRDEEETVLTVPAEQAPPAGNAGEPRER